MKDKTVNKVTRVVRNIVNALLGDGMVAPTEHVRRVRKVHYPEISC